MFTLEIVVDEENAWIKVYQNLDWFSKIYKILTKNSISIFALQIKKVFNYWIFNNVLWIYWRELYLFCILKSKILMILREAHDDNDHWAKIETLVRLKDLCYWLNQSQNVEKYIADCLKCAHHESATRSQLLNSMKVLFSFQFLNMNFINSLIETKADNKYIFNMICYFNKKIIFFATSSINASDVVEFLRKIFIWFCKSYVIYCDRRQHFNNFIVRNFLNFEDISISYSSSDFSRSTDIIEIFNKLLKNVLRKSFENVDWNQTLNWVTKFINFRVINYLKMSSIDIIIDSIQKITSTSSTLLMLFEWNIFNWIVELCLSVFHIKKIRRYIWFKSDFHNYVRALS